MRRMFSLRKRIRQPLVGQAFSKFFAWNNSVFYIFQTEIWPRFASDKDLTTWPAFQTEWVKRAKNFSEFLSTKITFISLLFFVLPRCVLCIPQTMPSESITQYSRVMNDNMSTRNPQIDAKRWISEEQPYHNSFPATNSKVPIKFNTPYHDLMPCTLRYHGKLM